MKNDRRMDAWLELQLAIGAEVHHGGPAPARSLIYHAQRAQPLIRNAARSDLERVILATLNALRELALAWVECDEDSKPVYRALVVAAHSALQIWNAAAIAEAVKTAEEVRADRWQKAREQRA